MDLDSGISALFSWQFILFACGIAIITYIVRLLLDNYVPKLSSHPKYDKVFLPLLPIVIGSGLAMFATNYAYPNNMNSFSDRIIFGCVCGAFSSVIYRVIRGAITQKLQTEISSFTQTTSTTYPIQPGGDPNCAPPQPPLPVPLPPVIDPTQPTLPGNLPAPPGVVNSTTTTSVTTVVEQAAKKS